MPESKGNPRDDDVESEEEEGFEEEEVIPEVTVDISNLTPSSFEVISKQVRAQSI